MAKLRYDVYQGVLSTNSKLQKLIIGAAALAFAAALALSISATSAKPVSGPGKVVVGVEASTWTSGFPSGPGLIPIGGSGQVNGEFTTAERYGIQIGLRAQERFVGTIDAQANENGKTGIYNAETGTSDGLGRAKWNYDWHVDLRGAYGVAAGKTLGDYSLNLETDIGNSIFGSPVPVDLTFGGAAASNDTRLYQQSWNPKFGNNPFDATAEGTYNFRLVLTPKTFNGPELAVAIQVIVSNP